MPNIYPFKALLPSSGLEIEVSANTHVDDKKRQIEILNNNPHTYLQIVKPYLKYNEEKNPAIHFPLAKKAIDKLIADKVMVQDTELSLYVYSQVNLVNNQQYLGLICNVAAQDYYNGKIKVHENTLTEKENQLIDHIEICGAIGEPVLLTHFQNDAIDELLNNTIAKNIPDIDFTDEVSRRHKLYKISDANKIVEFNNTYAQLQDFYIADGHHRSAACAGYYKRMGNSNGVYLAFLVPANHLHVDSFYRAYKAKNGFNEQTFLTSLGQYFEIQEAIAPVVPNKANTFGLCIGKKWYNLKFAIEQEFANAVEKLDVSILEKYVFNSILNIKDSKTDTQLTFIKGTAKIEDIEHQVQSGLYDIVFTVFPCKIEEVFKVADEKLIMPPKSTYIEPKLRTGLTVQLV